MSKNTYILGIIIVSISLLACSMILSTSINHLSDNLQNLQANSQSNTKNVMTIDEAASYLHISPESLEFICSQTSGSEIPFLKVDGQYVFTRNGLDKWLERPHNFSGN